MIHLPRDSTAFPRYPYCHIRQLLIATPAGRKCQSNQLVIYGNTPASRTYHNKTPPETHELCREKSPPLIPGGYHDKPWHSHFSWHTCVPKQVVRYCYWLQWVGEYICPGVSLLSRLTMDVIDQPCQCCSPGRIDNLTHVIGIQSETGDMNCWGYMYV